MSLAVADTTERVQQLIVLTEQLTGLMERESAAFEARRPRDALAGSQEIARLANLYRHESLRVRQDPALVASAPLALRRQLMGVTQTFDSALARHGRAIEAAKTVTEGLVRAIAEEVASQRSAGAGYGARGKAQTAPATAVTLNRKA